MKKNSQSQKIIIIILTITVIVACSLIIYISSIIENNEEEQEVVLINSSNESRNTLSDILKKYYAEFINRDGTKIYVKFDRRLYNEDGTSNKEFFNKIINELTDFLQETYYLIDEENEINIKVFYIEDSEPIIRINDSENFYESTDANTYLGIDSVDIVGEKNILINEGTLQSLSISGMKYSSITNTLGEKEGIDENGYEIYAGGDIKIAKYENDNSVRNIVYSGEYLTEIVSRVEENYSLNKVIEEYGDPAFGSLSDRYVGYRNRDFYIFFYEDEVSVYGYGYGENFKFEKYLREYIVDWDLAKFAKVTRAVWEGYYKYEFNEETEELLLIYPSKGVEINIKGNDHKGITFYSNYYFSDELKEEIRDGWFTLKTDEDLIHKVELERRKNS